MNKDELSPGAKEALPIVIIVALAVSGILVPGWGIVLLTYLALKRIFR